MKLTSTLSSACCLALAMIMPLSAATPLTPEKPIELEGTHGKFDFIKIDPVRHRLLACHTGNGSLDVVDVTTSKLIQSVPTGNAQGVAINDKNGFYYVSVSKPPQLVIVDAAKLEVVGKVPLSGPADLVAYGAKFNRVFVCNDEKPELWIIDPVAKRILTTITLPGFGMEDLGFGTAGLYLFQNVKDISDLAKIDPVTGNVLAKWSTSPADKPHGLAMVPGTDTVLIAGGTGKLCLLSLTTGKVLASSNIALKVDEIAYDPTVRRAYCASGLGIISVVAMEPNKLTLLATISSSPGTHSIAVDPQTHMVWIAFARENNAYVQSFSSH